MYILKNEKQVEKDVTVNEKGQKEHIYIHTHTHTLNYNYIATKKECVGNLKWDTFIRREFI